MKSIIGKYGCSPGADEILLGTFKPPLNLFTPLQTQYFKNLQWKTTVDQQAHQKQSKLMTSKKDSTNGKNKSVPHHPTDISATINPC